MVAVQDVSFTVVPGRVTGFLGPNGAGKTTTLRMLLGLVNATSGAATIDGVAYRDLAHAHPPGRRRARGHELPPGPPRPQPPEDDRLGRGHRVLPHRRGARPRRPGRRRPPQGGRLLDGDAAAARAGRGAPGRPRRPHPRRAVQRPRPPGDRLAARVPPAPGPRGEDRAGLLPPPGRDGPDGRRRGDPLPGRAAGPGPALLARRPEQVLDAGAHPRAGPPAGPGPPDGVVPAPAGGRRGGGRRGHARAARPGAGLQPARRLRARPGEPGPRGPLPLAHHPLRRPARLARPVGTAAHRRSVGTAAHRRPGGTARRGTAGKSSDRAAPAAASGMATDPGLAAAGRASGRGGPS